VSLPLLPMNREASGPFAGMVVVRLEQPGKPVIVLDRELIQRMEATFRAVPKEARGLVLASASERVFVAGADLKAISEWDDAQLMKYLEYAAGVFGMLARMPFPTAAAINGAALGGGLELAMHCDGVIAAPPPPRDGQPGKAYPVGLPEAGLGLCPGWGGTNLLPARMEPEEAIKRTATGKPLLFDEAAAAGIFDRIAPEAGKLIGTAMEWLAEQKQRARERDGAPRKWIGRPTCAAKVLSAVGNVREECAATEPGAAVCRAVEAGLSAGWESAIGIERRELVKLRHTPGARQSLEAFFSKAKK
jgi:enoyl-CoA hydratase/carnithine racemase